MKTLLKTENVAKALLEYLAVMVNPKDVTADKCKKIFGNMPLDLAKKQT